MGEKGTGEGVWKDVRDTEGLREEVLFKGDGGGGKLRPLGLSIRKRET